MDSIPSPAGPSSISEQVRLLEVRRKSERHHAAAAARAAAASGAGAAGTDAEAVRLELKIRERLGQTDIDGDGDEGTASALLQVAAGTGGATARTLSDIPLPTVLLRHAREPSRIHLAQGSGSGGAAGRVTGFRIEINGRRGTRAARQVLQHGRLATNNSSESYVDYGSAAFYGKKGATGVRVWVGCGASDGVKGVPRGAPGQPHGRCDHKQSGRVGGRQFSRGEDKLGREHAPHH
ncbi:hypothetical protein HK405_005313 [Cladochytrium tenue]|nr:hypothetical protein HK405_005313 [Cladochytrium tenue]